LNTLVIIIAIALLIFFFWRFKQNKNAAQKNVQAGEAFLATNSQLEGVKTTASGLQIKQLVTGTGSEYPSANSRVKVHYHGTLVDGTVFDSSVDRGEPIEFGLNQVIKGWTEGLQLMVVGEKARLFIPYTLGYGTQSTGAISGGSALIFDVELLEIG
jgi:peptidylprolyl isomerase